MIKTTMVCAAIALLSGCSPLQDSDYQGESDIILEGNMSVLSIDQDVPLISTPMWVVAGGEEIPFPFGSSVQTTPPSRFSMQVYDYPEANQQIELPSGGSVAFLKIYVSQEVSGKMQRVAASPYDVVVVTTFFGDSLATIADIEAMDIFDQESIELLKDDVLLPMFIARGVCTDNEPDRLHIRGGSISDGLILDLSLIGAGGVESCVDIEDRL